MMVSSTTGDMKKPALPLVTPFAISHRFEAKKTTNDRINLMLVLFMIPRNLDLSSSIKPEI